LQALASSALFLETLQRIQSVISGGDDSEFSEIHLRLIEILKDLKPHPTTITTRSHSSQPLLRTLRTKLGNQDVLPLGEEHDAAEALELLLQALNIEISALFHRHAHKTLQIKASLQTVLNPDYYFSSNSSSSDALLAGWKKIRLPVEGLIASRMQCVKCRHYFDTQYTPFTTLSMPLPTASSSSSSGKAAAAAATGKMLGIAHVPSGCGLITCFDAMFRYELVTGVHCPGCAIRASIKHASTLLSSPRSHIAKVPPNNNLATTKLQDLQYCVDERRPLPNESTIQALFQAAGIPYLEKTQTQVTRQSVVVRWPSVLVLQLRRSIWTPDGRLMKVVGHVKFPPALRFEAKDDQKLSYQLKSVVHHTGLSAGTGHYVTYRNAQGSHSKTSTSSSKWVKVSDESVKFVEEAEVLAADALLLFYEKF
jgi:hypothetical protein